MLLALLAFPTRNMTRLEQPKIRPSGHGYLSNVASLHLALPQTY